MKNQLKFKKIRLPSLKQLKKAESEILAKIDILHDELNNIRRLIKEKETPTKSNAKMAAYCEKGIDHQHLGDACGVVGFGERECYWCSKVVHWNGNDWVTT